MTYKPRKLKIVIVGPKNSTKYDVAKSIIYKNNDLDICPTFDSDIVFKGKTTNNFKYYISNIDVEIGYKNNAFLYVTTYSIYSKGVTLQDFYNSDIVVLDFIDLNNIGKSNFKSMCEESIIVVLDKKQRNDEEDIKESYHSFARIEELKQNYIYFNEDDVDKVSDAILEFMNAYYSDDNKKMNEFFEY